MASHFEHAALYARARPTYPPALARWLASLVTPRRAWDVGCGSGQLSVDLAEHVEEVVATDVSRKQVDEARPHPRVSYRVAPAEASGLEDGSVDLVVAAQAAHWFDLERFYREVRRVASGPDAVVALVTYGHHQVCLELDELTSRLAFTTLDGHWPPGREHVDAGYATLPFPFERIEPPPFRMALNWEPTEVLAYIRSWSASQALVRAGGEATLAAFEAAYLSRWPEGAREVTWPLTVLAGRVATAS